MRNFGLMREAEYQIKLAPNLPEMKISFQFAKEIPEEGYETYLFNGSSMDEPYRMELRSMEDNSLIQSADVNLCIERTDTPRINSSFILVTVERGDCLWDLAVEYYGDGAKWTEIYEWNRVTIGDNPSLIYEGTILNLPWNILK